MIGATMPSLVFQVHEARKYLSIHLRRETVHLDSHASGLYESPSYLFHNPEGWSGLNMKFPRGAAFGIVCG